MGLLWCGGCFSDASGVNVVGCVEPHLRMGFFTRLPAFLRQPGSEHHAEIESIGSLSEQQSQQLEVMNKSLDELLAERRSAERAARQKKNAENNSNAQNSTPSARRNRNRRPSPASVATSGGRVGSPGAPVPRFQNHQLLQNQQLMSTLAATLQQQQQQRPDGQAPRASSIVLVSNLKYTVTEADLRDLFSSFGPISRVTIFHTVDGRSIGDAQVNFRNPVHAERAVSDLSRGIVLDGRQLRVALKPMPVDASAATPNPAALLSLLQPLLASAAAGSRQNSGPLGGHSAAGKATVAARRPGAGNAAAGAGKAGKAKPRANAPASTAGKAGKAARRADEPRTMTIEELDAQLADYHKG
ncbi:hypothetical protein H696_00781 [Fonticula alba]|uniref:RRM domain-containing protein n=1 Tax=Fonticula alba TaxID=691883 RepID=A0A058ZFS1_FONAL|nr:hypothetical protein H696_00781 [Fonticula alba]KCV73240.1 hypothetical protein H696_00781 [Fonticula alba]|eukprot:XP_009492941.1 hypothetical protein H696_00781 [Fonticula alba]